MGRLRGAMVSREERSGNGDLAFRFRAKRPGLQTAVPARRMGPDAACAVGHWQLGTGYPSNQSPAEAAPRSLRDTWAAGTQASPSVTAYTTRLTRPALRLAQFTVAYNVAEVAVALTAGLLAGLVALVGYGLDSGIESISAVLVGLRLAARLRDGRTDLRRERRR